MIQRKQSIYLLLVSALMSLMIFFPVESFLLSDGMNTLLYSTGIKVPEVNPDHFIFHTYSVTVLIFIIMILSFINIFLYGNRIRQMRICVYTILLLFGLIVMMGFIYYYTHNQLDVIRHKFRLPAIIPVVSIIVLFQAFRGIRKDEELIKSYDRLR
jgi:hypothetical protein